jgi:MOSC domain-containing protein YiiM
MSAVPSTTDPVVLSVNISPGGIPKVPQTSVMARKSGLEGDGRNHAKHIRPDRAVSLWDYELLRAFVAEGFSLTPGAAGENLTVRNLNVQKMPTGTLLRIGQVVLQLEQPRKPCYVLDAIDPHLKDVVVGRIGFMASVVSEGIIEPGMPIEVISTPAMESQAPVGRGSPDPALSHQLGAALPAPPHLAGPSLG